MIQGPQAARPVHSAVAGSITSTRLAPYLAEARGSVQDAIRLYQWNIEVSGAVYELLHFFEVALRNTMDAQISVWNSTQINKGTGQHHSRDWLLDPSPLLRRLTHNGKDIAQAQQRASIAARQRTGPGRNRQPNHGDILAQTSFGTWRFLLPSNDAGRQRLWADALQHAFPYCTRGPKMLVTSVDHVYRIRNRVAHLEPLLDTRRVRSQLRNMRVILGEIDPQLEQWAMGWQRVSTALSNRPKMSAT